MRCVNTASGGKLRPRGGSRPTHPPELDSLSGCDSADDDTEPDAAFRALPARVRQGLKTQPRITRAGTGKARIASSLDDEAAAKSFRRKRSGRSNSDANLCGRKEPPGVPQPTARLVRPQPAISGSWADVSSGSDTDELFDPQATPPRRDTYGAAASTRTPPPPKKRAAPSTAGSRRKQQAQAQRAAVKSPSRTPRRGTRGGQRRGGGGGDNSNGKKGGRRKKNKNRSPGEGRKGASRAATCTPTRSRRSARSRRPQGWTAWQQPGCHDACGSMSMALGREVLDYVQYTDGLVSSMRAQVVADIAALQSVVTATFEWCAVVVYGSFASNLWLPGSDVDLVALAATADDARRAPAPVYCLYRFHDALQSCDWVAEVTVISSAKVPVMKVKTVTGLSMDVTFAEHATLQHPTTATHNGLATLDVVKQCCDAIPELRPLVLVTKQLLREHGLNEPYRGGLSSYSVVLMATAFLQMWRHEHGKKPVHLHIERAFQTSATAHGMGPAHLSAGAGGASAYWSHPNAPGAPPTETGEMGGGSGGGSDVAGDGGASTKMTASASHGTTHSSSAAGDEGGGEGGERDGTTCETEAAESAAQTAAPPLATTSETCGTEEAMDADVDVDEDVDGSEPERSTAPTTGNTTDGAEEAPAGVLVSAPAPRRAEAGAGRVQGTTTQCADRSTPASPRSDRRGGLTPLNTMAVATQSMRRGLPPQMSPTPSPSPSPSPPALPSASAPPSAAAEPVGFPQPPAPADKVHAPALPASEAARVVREETSAQVDAHEATSVDPATLGELLMDLLQYFGTHFRSDLFGLSVRDGGFYYPLPTPTAASSKWSRYGRMSVEATKLLFVEDPLAPGCNVAGSSFNYAQVASLFEGSFHALQVFRPTRFKPTLLSCLLHRSGWD